VGQGGDHPGGHQQRIGRGQGAGQVADREDRHQGQQRGLAGQGARRQRQDRRADEDAQGVAGHQQAGRRDRDVKIGGDLHQQAHDDELGDPDPEGSDGQGVEGDGHGGGSGAMSNPQMAYRPLAN
jgi:hypothetical protein